MNLQPTHIIVILVTALATGCDSQPVAPGHPPSVKTAQPTTPTATSSAEPKMPALKPIPDAPKLTEESLQGMERRYLCELPNDYRKFLLSSNGAFPSPDCVTFEEAGRNTASDVLCFFAIEDERAWASMDWHHKTYSDRLPKNTLPIGRDSMGNLWLLSLRAADAGSIFFWDHGSFDAFDETDLDNWPKVATSFTEFRDSLRIMDAVAKQGVPSRYSLVKQAADAMAERYSGFSTRGNPEFVWHCACDEEGIVNLEFVQYQIHAAVTHTCGYARLCAFKGLIKEGQPRLPD